MFSYVRLGKDSVLYTKGLLLCCFILLSSVIINACYATDLPPSIVKYLKQNFDGVNIRFDGLVELENGVTYIPVIPISVSDSNDPSKVITKINEDSKVPDLILFDNNYALLKLIKNDKGVKTFISGEKLPLRVKIGLLPQDLVVPVDLVIPKDLVSIIGDLKISVDEELETTRIDTTELNDSLKVNPSDQVILKPLVKEDTLDQVDIGCVTADNSFGLYGQKAYFSNIGSNKIYQVDLREANILDAIQVGSIPYASVKSHDNRFLYVISMAGNTLSAINTRTNKVENVIKVGLNPSGIAISPDGSKVFVSNSGSGNVSVVDTQMFEIVNNVDLKGIPAGIVAAPDNVSFYVFNRASGIVSRWNSINPDDREFLFIVQNPSHMSLDPSGKRLYITSRVKNKLFIYNVEKKAYDKVVDVGNKPVDVLLSSDGKKAYVLNAADDNISVVDLETFEVVKTIDVNSGGFPSSITSIPNTYNTLVTNSETDNMVMLDLDKGMVITTIPVGLTSKFLLLVSSTATSPVAPQQELNQE